MSQAKISVGRRPVDFIPFDSRPTEKVPSYLFIKHTDASGKSAALRGGIEEDEYALMNKFKVITNPYLSPTTDLTEGDLANYVTIIQGTDAEVTPFFAKIQSTAKEINFGKFDDKLTSLGHVQKCNNVIQFLIETSGLTFQLPKQDDGTETFAPGTIHRTPIIPEKNNVVHNAPVYFEPEIKHITPESTPTLWDSSTETRFSLPSLDFGIHDTFSSGLNHEPSGFFKHFSEQRFVDTVKKILICQAQT